MNAGTISKHIRLESVDIAIFDKPIHIGEVLELKAKVIYSDPKKRLVYVQVVQETLDPLTTAMSSDGTTMYEDNERNVYHLTYHVSPEIKLKQVMPKNYEENLLYL